ncbi:sigma 54-interacting transcriptional regulator [Litorisediminicola beolgyonensis]|uniref:Sigma 54-interacting transcriptional regulator n=1 Tax=Litorisediminicola beolgyonensis TaxID=1173614 RepID=A0ABW3ZF14_9RHOB
MKDTVARPDSLLHLLPEPALLIDTREDRIVEANARAVDLLKLPRTGPVRLERFLGKSMPWFLVFVEEVDHRGEGWTRAVSMTTAFGDPLRCELRARFVEGQPELLFLVIHDLDELDRRAERMETEGLHRAGLDTWRRAEGFFAELERRNQLILNAAGEGIYGINSEGKTTFVNRAAQEMLGWTSADLLGRDIHAMIHHHHLNGEVYPSHDCPIYRSFRFEQVSRIEDEVFWRKDGRPIRVEYVSTPIYDQQVLAGAVVIFRDITERKENERKLREALAEVADLRDRLEEENAYLQEAISTERAHHDIIGVSPATRQVLARIDLVARTDATVVISGETGTGKALVAAEIHKVSDRARRPLIHFNCGSVAPETVEVELFGQVRGASAAATRDTPGKLEIAHGGTLFLDDVEQLPPEIQSKLLVALQRRAVIRVGDTRERPLDIRVIAATTRSGDGRGGVRRIQQNLFMFLNVFPIECVPLRDRPDDIPLLAAHMLRIACRRLNRPVPVLTEGVVRQLLAYEWPGNVRELGNVMERAVVISKGSKLILELGTDRDAGARGDTMVRTEAEMQALVRRNIVNCLRETSGRVSGQDGAAALLGIRPSTLYSRIKSLNIAEEEFLAAPGAPR